MNKPNPGVGDIIEVLMFSLKSQSEAWRKATVVKREKMEGGFRVRLQLENHQEFWFRTDVDHNEVTWRWPK